MSATNDGGPAFPFIYECPKTGPNVYSGMSLRDYFAGQALTGHLANSNEVLRAAEHAARKEKGELAAEWTAIIAYEYADAMLAAREAKP